MKDYNELSDDEMEVRLNARTKRAKEQLLNVGIPEVNGKMKTVWIVTRIEFDGATSYKVFSNKEKAQEHVENFRGMYAFTHEYEVK